MASPQYNDQSIAFGSRTETIGGVSYVLEDINLTYPTKTIERPNQIGEPNGFAVVAGLPTGTAVVQIPNSSSNQPHLGDTFTDTFSGSSNETWVVTQIGAPIQYGSYRKVNVNLTMAHIGSGTYVNTGTPGWTNS
jgi:hypothetical protein